MSLGLRLSLLLLIAGCAEQALVVPDSDWRTVPAAQRDKVDRQHEAELAGTRAELAAAQASLAAFQEAPPMQRPQRPPSTATPDPDDVYGTVARDHEKARSEAFGRVEAAIVEVQINDLAWRRLRVDTAQARIAMVTSQRELTRAQTIDRNLPGTDTYDVAPLRGQFSRAQQRWYKLSTAAAAARDAFERASTSLASAKEAYAQLMRGGPMRLQDSIAAEYRSARLKLTGWTITRSDIRRRRGLRHFLDDAGASPQLRKLTVKLSPTPRGAPSASAPPPSETPRVTGAPAPPTADRRTGPPPAAPTATGAPPIDRRTSPPPATPTATGAAPAAAKPPADRASVPAARPAAPTAPAPDHPADRASSAARPATAPSARRTSEVPRAAPPPVPKEERAAGAPSAKPVALPTPGAGAPVR